MAKKTLSEIYDQELKAAANIASFKTIAINAMTEAVKQAKSRKCKTCEINAQLIKQKQEQPVEA